jgi:hypothetical protein
MTHAAAMAKLQRRLMVAQTPEIPSEAMDTIATLIVDVDREAREDAHLQQAEEPR